MRNPGYPEDIIKKSFGEKSSVRRVEKEKRGKMWRLKKKTQGKKEDLKKTRRAKEELRGSRIKQDGLKYDQRFQEENASSKRACPERPKKGDVTGTEKKDGQRAIMLVGRKEKYHQCEKTGWSLELFKNDSGIIRTGLNWGRKETPEKNSEESKGRRNFQGRLDEFIRPSDHKRSESSKD